MECLYAGTLLSDEKEQAPDRRSARMTLRRDDDWKSSYTGAYSAWFPLSEVPEEANLRW